MRPGLESWRKLLVPQISAGTARIADVQATGMRPAAVAAEASVTVVVGLDALEQSRNVYSPSPTPKSRKG